MPQPLPPRAGSGSKTSQTKQGGPPARPTSNLVRSHEAHSSLRNSSAKAIEARQKKKKQQQQQQQQELGQVQGQGQQSGSQTRERMEAQNGSGSKGTPSFVRISDGSAMDVDGDEEAAMNASTSQAVLVPASGSTVDPEPSKINKTNTRSATVPARSTLQALGQDQGQGGKDKGKNKNLSSAKGKQRENGAGLSEKEAIPMWARDKEAIKIALANPMAPRWPLVSDHDARIILSTLTASFPGLATYHIERDRWNRAGKLRLKELRGGKVRRRRKTNAEPAVPPEDLPTTEGSAGPSRQVNDATEENKNDVAIEDAPAPETLDTENLPSNTPPTPPELLSHAVFGINQIMRRMEKMIAWLSEEVEDLTGSNLASSSHSTHSRGGASGSKVTSKLIPTEPGVAESEDTTEARTATSTTSTPTKSQVDDPVSPLRMIFVCVADVNPPQLVEAIPLYATTWNSLVRASRPRLQTLLSEARARAGKSDDDGHSDQSRISRTMRCLRACVEVLVAPLPKGAEHEVGLATGLRRVAALGVTSNLPAAALLLSRFKLAGITPLLPPFPLHSVPSARLEQPYAATPIKTIRTTAPADPKSRKAKRIEEVRRKRAERKAKREIERKMEKRKKQLEINRKLKAKGSLLRKGVVTFNAVVQ